MQVFPYLCFRFSTGECLAFDGLFFVKKRVLGVGFPVLLCFSVGQKISLFSLV